MGTELMGLYYRLDYKKNTSQQFNNEEVRKPIQYNRITVLSL